MRQEAEDEDILPEYDFANGVQGQHREAYEAGANLIFLEPDPRIRTLSTKVLQALSGRENFQVIRAELDHADEQLDRGEYTEYDANTILDLAERVKTRGRIRLGEERTSGEKGVRHP